MDHPLTHTVLYGESGSRKSTSAATWPKPMLVFCFDNPDKAMPYLRRGEATDLSDLGGGTSYRDVISRKTGEVIVRVEYYYDDDGENPSGHRRFRARMAGIAREYDQWRTIVLDSLTYFELAARNQAMKENPTAKDPRQWYGRSTEAIESMVAIRLATMPLNVVVVAHHHQERNDLTNEMIRGIRAPGRMGTNSAGLPAGYGEVYRQTIKSGVALWQTQSDGLWPALSMVQAPNPCVAEYKHLWVTPA